jgi:hypothetical protein
VEKRSKSCSGLSLPFYFCYRFGGFKEDKTLASDVSVGFLCLTQSLGSWQHEIKRRWCFCRIAIVFFLFLFFSFFKPTINAASVETQLIFLSRSEKKILIFKLNNIIILKIIVFIFVFLIIINV